jgi:thymidylate synthase (FAD)
MSTTRIPVLDYGYVEIVDVWGRLDIAAMPGDEAIVAAARMSTGKGFQGWGPREDQHSCGRGGSHFNDTDQCAACHAGPGDEKLLRFLYANAHSTPFEMAGATFEVMAPIFVFREWHRHRVPFSYNEASARYAPLPDVNYMPTVERLMTNANGGNKQAGTVGGAEELTENSASAFQIALADCYREAERVYQIALKSGVPKELARVHLPVGRYSKMRASANLRGWMNFMTLRQAPNAQYEIRVYADAVHDLLAKHFERSLALFDEKKAK